MDINGSDGWLFYLIAYLAGFVTFATADYIYFLYVRRKKRRQAKILESRLVLLKEFAEGKRVA